MNSEKLTPARKKGCVLYYENRQKSTKDRSIPCRDSLPRSPASEGARELAGGKCLRVVAQGAPQAAALLRCPVLPAGAGPGLGRSGLRTTFAALQTGRKRHRALLVAATPGRVLEVHLHHLQRGRGGLGLQGRLVLSRRAHVGV